MDELRRSRRFLLVKKRKATKRKHFYRKARFSSWARTLRKAKPEKTCRKTKTDHAEKHSMKKKKTYRNNYGEKLPGKDSRKNRH
jgi:DNA-binding transcriptional regulator GbsR (MarR family)